MSELCAGSPFIIFSMYFAITSASRFTESPGFSDPRLVSSTVWGMMAMVQRFRSSFATVRLIPSMHIDPL